MARIFTPCLLLRQPAQREEFGTKQRLLLFFLSKQILSDEVETNAKLELKTLRTSIREHATTTRSYRARFHPMMASKTGEGFHHDGNHGSIAISENVRV